MSMNERTNNWFETNCWFVEHPSVKLRTVPSVPLTICLFNCCFDAFHWHLSDNYTPRRGYTLYRWVFIYILSQCSTNFCSTLIKIYRISILIMYFTFITMRGLPIRLEVFLRTLNIEFGFNFQLFWCDFIGNWNSVNYLFIKLRFWAKFAEFWRKSDNLFVFHFSLNWILIFIGN